MPQLVADGFITTGLPGFNEEYFEWIDLFEAVQAATGQFTMIELGAGWGRWLVNAAALLRYRGGPPGYFIGVEPEPAHFAWMKQHCEDNRLDLTCCRLIRAAVSNRDGEEWFYVGREAEWYGQAIAPPPDFGLGRLARWLPWLRALFSEGKVAGERVVKLEAVSLNTLLEPLVSVDLLDMDVQGAELGVLRAAPEQLRQKVRRVHIATHGTELESHLRSFFGDLGWKKINDFPHNSESLTQWGPIKFQDGVQTWVNPLFAS